jgi:predicted GIY-YIG superfamily endonuclease
MERCTLALPRIWSGECGSTKKTSPTDSRNATGVHTLVWYEVHASMESAIRREKTIKEWKRYWKVELIEKQNPQWRDLYQDLF